MPKHPQARPRPDRSETLLIEARAIARDLAAEVATVRTQFQNGLPRPRRACFGR